MGRAGCGGAVALLVLACSRFDGEAAPAPGGEGDTAARADAGASPDGGGGGCASFGPTDFCEDFEDDAPLGFGWTEVATGTGTSVQYDTTTPASGRRGARAAVSAAAPTCSYAKLRREIAAPLKGARLTAALRPVATPGALTHGTMNLRLGGKEEATGCNVELVVVFGADGEVSGARIHVQHLPEVTDRQLPLTRYPTTSRWSEVTFDVRSGATAAPELEVFVDGLPAFDAAQPLGECSFGTGIALELGLHCEDKPATLLFDDVRATFTR